jgi:polyphosphate kinase 2 (PPK2 family)
MKDRNSELKRWKISPTDKMAKQMRAVYQHAIYEMLEKTNSDHASWSIVDNNEKWS